MNTTFTTYAEKKAKQILNLLQGYTKGIRMTAILILLLMGVNNAWGKTVNGPRIYFDNSSMKMTSTQVYFVVGHNSFSRTYGPMTEISDTKLLYRDISSETYYKWTDATYVGFIQVGSKWGDGDWGSSNLTNATNYTAANSSWNSFDWQNTYYCKADSKGGAVTIAYKSAGYSGIPKYNATQAAKLRNDISSSYTIVDGTWPTTLKLKGTYLSGNGSSARSEISGTASGDAESNRVYGAVVTGKITHTYNTITGNYIFEGWGTSTTPSTTNASYEYNITANTTVYAFFTKAYTVTYGKKGESGSSTVSATVTANSTTKSINSGTKVAAGSTINLTANPANGYRVVGWYSDANCTNQLQNGGNTYNAGTLTAAKTVYVKFEETKYDVTIQAGANGSVSPSGEQAVGSSNGLEVTANPNLGYKFTEWVVTDGAIVSSTTTNPTTLTATSSGTLTAKFTANTYTVKFHKNGGEGEMADQGFTYDIEQALTANAFTRTGYTFTGWNTNANGSGTAYTNGQRVQNLTDDDNGTINLYAKWTEILSTITITTNPAEGGSVKVNDEPFESGHTVQVGVATTKQVTTIPNEGYGVIEWGVSDGNIVIINGGHTVTLKSDGSGREGTLTARYTPLSRNIQFNKQSGEGGTETATVTYTKKDYSPDLVVAPTRTGYTFGGYYSEEKGAGEQVVSAEGAWLSNANGYTDADGNWLKSAENTTLYAKWTAKQCTITLDNQDATTAGTTSVTATYDAAMPTDGITMPTKTGYVFGGYFDQTEGEGTQYYNADGTSEHKWDKVENTTLYAHFVKVEITAITLDKSTFEPVEAGGEGYVTATPTLEPTPTNDVKVCWKLLYSNGSEVEGRTATQVEGNTVKFSIAGLASGNYKIEAVLRTGNSCEGGIELSTQTANFIIASNYTITVKYTCDGKEIQAASKVLAHVTEETEITAPNITGYTFSSWEAGDGVTIESTNYDKVKITAIYDGYLTAKYEKRKLIFLDLSTLPNKDKWTAPHIYLYSSKYWDDSKGTGAETNCVKKGAMLQVPNTENIWYYDYETVNNFNGIVAFTSTDKMSQGNFWDCEVIFREDFTSGTPVFVPASDQEAEIKNDNNSNHASYYSKGYWVKYMDGTGYWMIIYDQEGNKELVRREFTSDTQRMTMTSIVDLEAEHTYQYEIYRNDGYYYKGGDITYTNSSTYRPLNEANKHSIKTTETGDYTFTLDYFTGDLQIKVQYPGEVGDYRILYTDDVRNGRYKPSQIISQNNKEPLVSFFIRPNDNDNPTLKVQSAARVTGEGVTWATTENEIFFKPNANWKSDGARFAAWFNGDKWKDLNKNGDVYSCEIPLDATEVIFCRMDPKNATNNWSNKWNQTGHLALTTNNLYTLKEGEWGNKLYLKPNSNWFQKDGNQKAPRFAAYFFNSNSDYEWVSMGNPVDGVYSCDIPAKVYKKVIFCRMDGGNETNDWSNKYNQSSDLIVPTDGKTLYTVKDGTWDKGGGSWSVGEGSWSTINGSITDLSVQLKNKLAELDLKNIKETEGSVFNIHLSNNEGILTIEKVAFYTGNYYIRVDAVDGKWYDYKTNPDNLMTYSAFSESEANSFGDKYSHYVTKFCEKGTNIKFTIANDYSPCITDTLIKDIKVNGNNPFDNLDNDGTIKNDDKYKANVRFMWNRKTNRISRAYIGPAGDEVAYRQFLILKADKEIKNASGGTLSNTGDTPEEHQAIFSDTQNWIYERTIQVQPETRVKLYACYPEVDPVNAQYFRGTYDNNNATWNDNNSVQILGGKGTSWNTIRVIYDFKTNRLMAAWMPTGEIDGEKSLQADMMILRRHQEDAQCVTFNNDSSKLTDIKTVYGVMRFNRWILNNRANPDDLNIEHCTKKDGNQTVYDENTTDTYHPVLALNEQAPINERGNYFISFPFEVHLSDVFGFGQYGTHWIISNYNGLRRAQRGFFIDNCVNEDCTNWDYIWDPSNFKLEANKGYLLSLDLDLMKHDNTSFWAHNIGQVELFFPSTANVSTIEKTNYLMDGLSDDYICNINHNKDGNNPEGDRRVKDTYWRCIGVPSFANYDGSLYKTETDAENEENPINWKNSYTWQADYSGFPFLYEWNTADNSITPVSTQKYTFRPTFAYLVQNGNPIYWSAVNTKPSNIVARRQAPGEINNYEWKLTLSRNEQIEDQAFVRLSDNEQITTEFDFNQDMSKEFNYGRSDIYTLIGYEKAAANSLPLSEQTTLIPLGLSIEYNGDYTIAMPDRMENIGVTLIDTESNTRTNLSAGMEYVVTLNKGDYNNRFFIEISPIQQTPTDIEYVTGDSNSQDNIRKVLIDNILYIVRDGQIFDARGARVK